ncbi:uncharacterized protein LOC116463317 isoform X2 [Hylobates moloch]|uniref:uncharacterized protein LOC116463317 isoform X2 n=1 Tax=Hylobates moloch TaxID=81572 RepID=UPI0026760D94|nr:uncharacterized protein LOC116463317 isoform X2 [Hylobates moloch]
MDGEGGARGGRRGKGSALGARGRGGPSLPARCSRRRSDAALSPQRDLFSSLFFLNSSSRERLVVTGRAGWMGMGRGAGRSALGFWPTLAFLLCSFTAATSPCKILKCNSEFWSATSGSHAPASDDTPEFCAALRSYALCTRRTARTCRGDLAYHSAVHGIEDLMSQHNCSKDGPTSQPRLRTLPPAGDSQERSDSPEICHYEKSFHKHSATPNYTHCGLFGDPHLRTFTDRFQTCKVQGAWPLIDNNYLNVQVTNTPVLPGSAATATSKMQELLGRGAWAPGCGRRPSGWGQLACPDPLLPPHNPKSPQPGPSTSGVWGEEQGLRTLSSEQPWQGLQPLISSLKPCGHTARRDLLLAPASFQPRVLIQEPKQSHLCCCAHSTKPGFAPKSAARPQRVILPAALQPHTLPTHQHPRQPLCCSPGTSHTLARRLQNVCLPLPPRGPAPSARTEWAGGRVLGARPLPPLAGFRWSLCWK